MSQQQKYNLNINVIAAFLTKLSEFGRLELKVFIEVWFWLYGATFITNGNLVRTVKRDK